MKTSILLMVLLFGGFSITSQAQTGLFIDYTQSGWFLQLNGVDPFTTYNYAMIQSAGSGSITFSLAENGTYSKPLGISISTDGNGNGQTLFFVKGTALGPATWQVCQPDLSGCGATLSFSVVTINSLVYQAIDSPLDTNPNTGAGNRIYPERATPGDTVNRKRVLVRATLSAPVNGVSILFKSFDLDDPSANSGPVDANGSSGGDNRQTTNKEGILSPANQSGTTNTVTLTTNASGVADADFTVTSHPGDNFMVAASGDPNVLSGVAVDGITLEDSGGNTLPQTKVKNTPMLTVWRKIHLEVDNMGAVSGNSMAGTITNAVRVGNTTVLTVTSTLDANQYENGRMTITGMSSYNVLSNTGTTVTIDKKINTTQATNAAFTMVDDDDYDNDDSPNNGDANETTVATLTALDKMQTSDSAATNVYAPAYIMPSNDGGGNAANNGAAAFDLNVETTEIANQVLTHYGANGNGRDDFWIAYIQIAYQGRTIADFDSSSETNSDLGITGAVTLNSIASDCSGMPQGGVYTFSYQEVIRDSFAFVSLSNDNLTTPHELGHQFGLDHINNTVMGGYNNNNFDPAHIHILRCRVKSPGLP